MTERVPDSRPGILTAHCDLQVWPRQSDPRSGASGRSVGLVSITAALATDLRILTAALDEPGFDVEDCLGRLASDVAATIPTYCGLSVTVADGDPPFTVAVLAQDTLVGDARTSLRLTLTGAGDTAPVIVTLYAGSPGTFVDLAADLAWLTAHPLSDVVLDGDLVPPTSPGDRTRLSEASVVNQAIGALIGQGYSPTQAEVRLNSVGADAGISRYTAAGHILAGLTTPDVRR